MTIIFEVPKPLQKNPGRFKSLVMYRAWWLWFSVSLLRVSFKEFTATAYDWSEKSNVG